MLPTSEQISDVKPVELQQEVVILERQLPQTDRYNWRDLHTPESNAP